MSAYNFVSTRDIRPKALSSADHELIIRQEPDRARVCTSREKDRRPVDPPPIIQLKILTNSEDAINFIQSPHYFMCANLMNVDETSMDAVPTHETLAGTIVSSLHKLKDIDNSDGAFFIFGDLSIRVEGTYRLRFSLFEVATDQVMHVKSVISSPFTVYAVKQFPGMAESTFLSRSFSDQGVRIRVRKENRINLYSPLRSHATNTHSKRTHQQTNDGQADDQKSLDQPWRPDSGPPELQRRNSKPLSIDSSSGGDTSRRGSYEVNAFESFPAPDSGSGPAGTFETARRSSLRTELSDSSANNYPQNQSRSTDHGGSEFIPAFAGVSAQPAPPKQWQTHSQQQHDSPVSDQSNPFRRDSGSSAGTLGISNPQQYAQSSPMYSYRPANGQPQHPTSPAHGPAPFDRGMRMHGVATRLQSPNFNYQMFPTQPVRPGSQYAQTPDVNSSWAYTSMYQQGRRDVDVALSPKAGGPGSFPDYPSPRSSVQLGNGFHHGSPGASSRYWSNPMNPPPGMDHLKLPPIPADTNGPSHGRRHSHGPHSVWG